MLHYSGTELRRVREDAGVSREQLAIWIGRTASAVIKYETGRIVPSGPVLGRLAGALRCTVDHFYVQAPADVA